MHDPHNKGGILLEKEEEKMNEIWQPSIDYFNDINSSGDN